jgi:hypothetical protein
MCSTDDDDDDDDDGLSLVVNRGIIGPSDHRTISGRFYPFAFVEKWQL